MKLPLEAKRVYADCSVAIKEQYLSLTARTPEDIPRVKAQMLVKVGRLKGRWSYKYAKNPADVSAATPFQSFVK
jgi:hypothetical protein